MPFLTKGFQYREGKGEVVRERCRRIIEATSSSLLVVLFKGFTKERGGAGIKKGKSACCLMYENRLQLSGREQEKNIFWHLGVCAADKQKEG